MRADELKGVVDTLTERLNNHIKLTDDLRAELKEVREAHVAYRLAADNSRTAVELRVAELQKNKDIWSGRLFTMFVSLASAALGVALTLLLKKS